MNSLPTRILNSWLNEHCDWSHNEWLELLDLLRESGQSEFADTEEGQAAIGFYLEQKKKRVNQLKQGG